MTAPPAAPAAHAAEKQPHDHPLLLPLQSDGTRAGDLAVIADRWRRLGELARSAAERTAAGQPGDLLADQIVLWQNEIALYRKRAADLQRDLEVTEAARPLLRARHVEARLQTDDDLQHVASEADALIDAAKAQLADKVRKYDIAKADREALLVLARELQKAAPTPAARAELAQKRWQAAQALQQQAR